MYSENEVHKLINFVIYNTQLFKMHALSVVLAIFKFSYSIARSIIWKEYVLYCKLYILTILTALVVSAQFLINVPILRYI